MPDFNIVKINRLKKKSFRVAQICDQFDFSNDEIKESFCGEIIFPDNWKIGLIVGKSGTGKTTIAKNIFGDYFCNFEYKENCVIDDFDQSINIRDITKMLNAVGFSTVPSWLKPYSVLSNGEKMRVDLARALLSKKDIIVFDEYTSVIDREVAKIGAMATKKSITKMNKQFIAISCHFDIIEWLQPDWIFSTDKMEMLPRGCLQRPKIKLSIKQVKGYWPIFRRYHYLNHDLHKAAQQFVAFYKNKPVGFCGIINFPHPKIKPYRKIHRLVVLPDYQGIGIGYCLSKFVANIYKKKKEVFGVTTSIKAFAKTLLKSKEWKLIRAGCINPHTMKDFRKTESSNRNTYSFKYIGT